MSPMKTDDTRDRDALLEPPREFRDGFGWTTLVGVLFCGLVMMPGGIYLGLMTGAGIGSAASWSSCSWRSRGER
jgi:hypothetical protein